MLYCGKLTYNICCVHILPATKNHLVSDKRNAVVEKQANNYGNLIQENIGRTVVFA